MIEKNFWNSRLKADHLEIFWNHYNILFKKWKGSKRFETKCFFNLFLEDSQIFKFEQLEFILEKIIEFRNLKEKLEKVAYSALQIVSLPKIHLRFEF